MSEADERTAPVLADENPPTLEEAADRLLDDASSDTVGEAVPEPRDLGLDLPDDPEAARMYLLREIASARQEAGEYLETLQRVAADFDNFRNVSSGITPRM